MSSNSTGFEGLQSLWNSNSIKPDSSFLWPENKKDGSFLQARINTSYDFRQITRGSEHECVVPVTKRSTSSLSTQSLGMCTESLGNETGCGIGLTLDEFSYLVSEKQGCDDVIKQRKTRKPCKKIKQTRVFPPPLSSISGSNGSVKLEAHREGDRLVITASDFRTERFCFKAVRENGRLRLFLLKKEVDEKLEKDGEKLGELFCSRCNGDGSRSEKLPRLPVCVALS